jgi:hypothetical protein
MRAHICEPSLHPGSTERGKPCSCSKSHPIQLTRRRHAFERHVAPLSGWRQGCQAAPGRGHGAKTRTLAQVLLQIRSSQWNLGSDSQGISEGKRGVPNGEWRATALGSLHAINSVNLIAWTRKSVLCCAISCALFSADFVRVETDGEILREGGVRVTCVPMGVSLWVLPGDNHLM